MATIQQVLLEDMPAVQLIGKRYTDKDRDEYGSFSSKWHEWFQNGYFDALCACEGIMGVSDDFIGAMRHTNAGFEYWIGMFMDETDVPPAGFERVFIPAGKLGVCYVYGKDDSTDLFSMDACNACTRAWAEQGWQIAPDAWRLERYNCPRFTTPDEKGNVILDCCAYVTQ